MVLPGNYLQQPVLIVDEGLLAMARLVAEEEFAQAAEELLRAITPSSGSGSSQHPEKEIRDFFKKFDDFTSASRYFARTLYHSFWRPRLKQYNCLLERLGDGQVVARARVVVAIKHYKDLLALTAEIPVWADVIGSIWMCRHRSSLAAFEGELRRSQRTPEAVRGFERAAMELENIPEPSPFDRANAAGFQSTSSFLVGFQYLGLSGITEATKAFRAFCSAAKYARQRQWICSESGLRASQERLYRIRYWQYVAGIRLCALRHRFDAARKRLRLGIQCAEKLGYIPAERWWYESVDDLRNYCLVIDAYEHVIQRDHIEGARNRLLGWVASTDDVRSSWRRLCIYQLKVALDVLVLEKASDHRAASEAFEELEGLSEDLRVVGRNELFIFEAIRAFHKDISTLDNTVSLVKSAIIPGSIPTRKPPQITVKAKEQDFFLRMPEVFWWLFRMEKIPEIDGICYTLLLYVRCIAEYWSCIYKKRLAGGDGIDRYSRDRLKSVSSNVEAALAVRGEDTDAASSDLEFPRSFGFTNWSDLRGCLCQLAAEFNSKESQKLSTLYLGVARFEDEILPEARSGKLAVSALAELVKSLIMGTQKNVFPHVVRANCYAIDKGRATLKVQRLWRGIPRELTLTHAGPRTQEPGRYYFLSPAYNKRKPAGLLAHVKLYPLGGSTCFGKPADKPALLLVEGSSDVMVFKAIFDRFNPHWKASIDILDRKGATNLYAAWENYCAAGAHSKVFVVLDDLGGSSSAAKIQRAAEAQGLGLSTKLLSPDLEGIHPEALILALQEVRSELSLDETEIATLIKDIKTTKTKGTAKLICDLVWERSKGTQQENENTLKNDLATALARHMLALGPVKSIEEIIGRVLGYAFRPAQYMS